MQIKDILRFNKDKYFGGAVQANWFYDTDRVAAIADSYVFHGPKYHGVSEQEWQNTSYKLNDTATYALKLSQKAIEVESNRFCMTIAGYGTGKSHLSVALAALLSGHDEQLRRYVLTNISAADRAIGESIQANLHKNMVIVLNGMRDFNLNSEMLACAKKSLAQHGLSEDIFSELTTHYRQAISFCQNTFETHKASYERQFSSNEECGSLSLQSIVDALENADKKAYDAVNEVYKEFMGTYIHVESGVSAADILSIIVKKYCIEQNIFDRIYILFDEFGRYIEFTANNPQVAGDSSLQQIFEAVQNANGRIVFDAFIQSDLNSYIRRVESGASNISRYVGRYENSEKFYLSSNFETILANLIEKKNPDAFDRIIVGNINGVYARYHKNIIEYLRRWAAPEISKRAVWTNGVMYNDVIAKGCYPVHPITVWFLANTSSWMQQRSTIAYTAEMFDSIKVREVSGKWLPYIYPVDIIGTSLFDEMLSSEEKGLVANQNCMTYQTIITKLNGKISGNAVKILRAVLISNILKFSFSDKAGAINALRLCSGLSEAETANALVMLENDYYVISFNQDTNRYDLNAEAHGKQEYTICVSKKMISLRDFDPISEVDEELLRELRLNISMPTKFGQDNYISSSEWQYEKLLVNISQVNETFCRRIFNAVKEATNGESLRGIIVYLYCGTTSDRDLPIVTKLISSLELQKMPIVFCLLRDSEETWLGLLKRRAAYRKFTDSEKEMYSQFLLGDSRIVMRKIASEFARMEGERNVLTDNGIESLSCKINEYCYSKFKECYPDTIPFSITEFEKKATPSAKKVFLSLCRNMFSGAMCNKQSYQGLDPTEKRRIMTALSTATANTSWQVLDSNCTLCEPRNASVKKIYHEVMNNFTADSQHTVAKLFRLYCYSPYGLNYYSLFLFIIYVLSLNKKKIALYDGTTLLSNQQFIDKYLSSDKKMLENLFKLRVVIKTQTDDEVLLDLIQEIKRLCYTESCSELLKSLKALKASSDNADSVKGDIAACELKLQQGINTNSALYGTVTKLENLLEQVKEKFNLIKIVSVLANINKPQIDTKIDEYSEYMYSPTYCSRIEKILTDAEKQLDEHFDDFVSHLKCSYSQSSEFKKNYLRVVKQLGDIGKRDYAETLKNRIEVALQRAELEQKYASTIAEANRFIASIDNSVHTFDFVKSEDAKAQIAGWLKTFSSADDMEKSVKEKFILDLNNEMSKVDEQIKNLENQIEKVLQEIKAPTESALHLSEQISKALMLHPDTDAVIILTDAQQLIEEFNALKSNTVQVDTSTIEMLESEYNSKWKGTVCDRYVKELIASIRDNLSKKRSDWLNKNVAGIKSSIDTMTVSQCVQWQGIISELPEFLTEDDLEEITSLSAIVTEKVKTQKINGIVEMFAALSDEEKAECLLRLRQL